MVTAARIRGDVCRVGRGKRGATLVVAVNGFAGKVEEERDV